MAPIYIQTGGAGAQLGGGLGAGFSKGVSDAMEQQRQQELMRLEAELRKEAEAQGQRNALERLRIGQGLDIGKMEVGAEIDQRNALERMRVGQGLDIGKMEAGAKLDQTAWEARHQAGVEETMRREGREDQLLDRARQDAFVGTQNNAVAQLDLLRQQYGSKDGGSDPYDAEVVALLDQADGWVAGALTDAEVLGHMVTLDQAIAGVEQRRDLQHAQGLLAFLQQPGEGGQAAEPTPETMALQAAIASGDAVQAMSVASGILQGIENEQVQAAAVEKSAVLAQEGLATFEATPMPSHIPESRVEEYGAWKLKHSARIRGQMALEMIASASQGLGYDPVAGLLRVQSIASELDPITLEMAAEQTRQKEEALRREAKVFDEGAEAMSRFAGSEYFREDEVEERRGAIDFPGPREEAANIFDEVRGLTEKQVSDLAAEALAAGDESRFDALSNILMAMEQAQE